MNLQDAENEIQDHGVFASGSEDATGEGRSQITDSNWQVVAQDPDEGTPFRGRPLAFADDFRVADKANALSRAHRAFGHFR